MMCQKSWDTKFINKVGASSLEKRALLRPAKSFGASTAVIEVRFFFLSYLVKPFQLIEMKRMEML